MYHFKSLSDGSAMETEKWMASGSICLLNCLLNRCPHYIDTGHIHAYIQCTYTFVTIHLVEWKSLGTPKNSILNAHFVTISWAKKQLLLQCD